MNKNIIDTVRKNINGTELTIVAKTESLQELWKEKQELILQMNAAKKQKQNLQLNHTSKCMQQFYHFHLKNNTRIKSNGSFYAST